MRKLSMLMVLVCMAAACDDDEETKPSDASVATSPDAATSDASVLDAAPPDAALPADGSAPVQRSLLPRPGLARPPAGKLPDDLKPPVR